MTKRGRLTVRDRRIRERGITGLASVAESFGPNDPRWRRSVMSLSRALVSGKGVDLDEEGKLQVCVDPQSDLAYTPKGALTLNTEALESRLAAIEARLAALENP